MLKKVISTLKDFDSLKSISNTSSIFLHISSQFTCNKIPALDMKKFKGTIFLSFEDPKKRKIFHVISNQKRKYAFFENINPNQVIYLTNSNIEFKYSIYEKKPTLIFVSNEKELLKAIKLFMQQEKIGISLKKDIVVTKKIPEVFQNIPCNSNGFALFSNYENPVFHKKVPNILVDKVIDISTISDFYFLEYLSSGSYVAQLKNNITNFALKSISLENFTGTLYILGNSHQIKQGVIKPNQEGVGLISSLHPYANITIRNLSLSNIKFKENVYNGGYIGYRMSIKNKLCGPTGSVLIQNCQISQSEFIGKCINPFIGCADENMYIENSSFENIVANQRNYLSGNNDTNPLYIPNSFDKTRYGMRLERGIGEKK